ncbi:amidohydrolase family protein [Frankia gtarii]|uniref:amidohydrolase family protein n=1 Tax=Frankia gtarii TaxID=2950102 RepID=UPI0021C21D1E|nr:amidohydrolase [Frankia gtarii]
MTTLAAPGDTAVLPSLGYPLYDADQHYYETADALTRHLAPEYKRLIKILQTPDGRTRMVINNKLYTTNPDPTFPTVAAPGVFEQYFRSNNTEGRELASFVGKLQESQPEYTDRDARIAKLDEQGVAATIMLPTVGVAVEGLLTDKPDALHAIVEAFNRWIEDEWGYSYQDRIISTPVLSLADPDLAVKELERVRDLGARIVVLVPGPVRVGAITRSPGNPVFDRFWATAAEAGIVVSYHTGEAGYEWVAEKWGEGAFEGLRTTPLPEIMQLHVERPIQDTIAALVGHGVFERHPALKVATIEAGSTWVLDLVRRIRNAYGKIPQKFAVDPVESFREHVWVAPFYEDDLLALKDAIGIGHIIFGSDWPHPEGLPTPGAFVRDAAVLSEEDRKLILSDNLKSLLQL